MFVDGVLELKPRMYRRSQEQPGNSLTLLGRSCLHMRVLEVLQISKQSSALTR